MSELWKLHKRSTEIANELTEIFIQKFNSTQELKFLDEAQNQMRESRKHLQIMENMMI